jgi:hypothetical protein
MDFINNSDHTEDALYLPVFEAYVRKFQQITSTEFHMSQVSPLIETFKRSASLNLLIADPTNEEAKACVQQFLNKRPNISRAFLPRLIAYASAKINIIPGRAGYSTDSLTVKVVTAATEPPAKITNLTANAMRDILREDLKNVQTFVVSHRNVPTEVKLKLDQSILQQIVNSQFFLYKVIQEANRNNGKQIDPYVREQVRNDMNR